MFSSDLEDYEISINGSAVQIFFSERGLGRPIPATRVASGTLRYLSLLAILFNPNPSSLICLEDPEVGLDPGVMPQFAELLKEVSQKRQIIVTTHSEILIDSLADTPESVLICEKGSKGTRLSRLGAEDLKSWLDSYHYGELSQRPDYYSCENGGSAAAAAMESLQQ
jgi:predicted ATPase